ncbi:hypothetical protein TNCV_1475091 [Trichonephila clavipes]|nr:hypothetical protein TNCV_1475091 [Trichonephila clavipes]
MFTKYHIIKFIDFCKVWFLPESVARVAAIVGDHAATLLGIDSKRLWMCSWGKADREQLPHVAKVDLDQCGGDNTVVQQPLSTVSPDSNPTNVVLQTDA